nr:efflux RND transporter periplasmic adaptor subunit [Echinimonas agarilytica]
MVILSQPSYADSLPVQTIRLKPEPFYIELSRTGRIDYRYITNLSFKTNGFVDQLFADAGQRVYLDDSIATMELTDLKAGQDTALARYNKTQQDLGRAKKLYRDKTVSKDFLEQAEIEAVQAQSDLEKVEYDINKAQITVPFDSIVVERLVQPGEQVSAGSPVFSVASIKESNLVVRLNLTQQEIDKIERLMKVSITLANQHQISGRIITIGAVADAETGLYEVEIAPELHGNQAFPGQWVKVTIGISRSQQVYQIPMLALAGIVNGNANFVVHDQGKYSIQAFPILHMDQQFIYVPAEGSRIKVVTRGWDRLVNQLSQ